LKHKKYKNYQDYINSNEWRALKKKFYAQYEGFNDVCEVSGKQIKKGTRNAYMCLHHWQYPKDWNDDSIKNLILVCSDVHEWIHSHYAHGEIDTDKYNNKTKYRLYIVAHMQEKKKANFVIRFIKWFWNL